MLDTPPETLAWGEVGFDPACGFDEVDGVVVVLFHAGGDGEDVGVEDDVFRREADFIDEHAVGHVRRCGFSRRRWRPGLARRRP